jgi:GT2 family glycosyltransferase
MPDMWIKMMSAYEKNYPCGVVGCMLSKKTKMQSYGGSLFISDKKGDYVGPMLAPKSDEYVKCDLANWNCFLINNEIVMKVGLIDSRYEHAMGDFDYSFRMRRSGYTIILAKEYVGYCENNGIHNTYKDKQLGRKKRLKKLFSANGLPVKSWYYFTKTYYEHGHIRNFLVPYIKYLSCIILGRDCD